MLMNDVKLTDGGLGSELRMRGVDVPSHVDSIWSAQALIDAPEMVKTIHVDYIKAGSDYITINNYALTQPILKRAGLQSELKFLTLKAIELARKAILESGKPIKLIGSLPPLETSYRADLILPEDQMIDYYGEIVEILTGQVDVIVCETMASGSEAKCALQAGLNSQAEVWVSWTLHGNRANLLPSGESIREAFTALDGLQPNAYLVNCCGANLAGMAINELSKLTDLAIGGYANAENIVKLSKKTARIQNPEDVQKQSMKSIDETEFAHEVAQWIQDGALIVGGCCRTRPSYIQKLREMIDSRS